MLMKDFRDYYPTTLPDEPVFPVEEDPFEMDVTEYDEPDYYDYMKIKEAMQDEQEAFEKLLETEPNVEEL